MGFDPFAAPPPGGAEPSAAELARGARPPSAVSVPRARCRGRGPRARVGLVATLLLVTLSGAGTVPVAAQTPTGGSLFTPALAEDPAVARALEWLEENFPEQVEEWIRITEIPAPSGAEEARGRYLAEQLRAEGLEPAVDALGNVVAVRRGAGGGPTLVLAAHLDTVHPECTDVTVTRDGDVLRAPGVSDNSGSVSNMLAVLRAMERANVRTRGDVVFLGTTQEEVGLRGMIHWLEENPGVADMLVALDGGLGSINYGALGIYWTRYRFGGDGAHTNSSAGRPHPVRALADAVRSIYEIEIPEGRGGAVYNVGMLDGGTIFNAIPERVSFTMDLRSVNPALLDSLQAEIDDRVARAAEAHGVEWWAEEVNRMPAGGTEEQLADRAEHPLVLTAVDVYGHLDLPNRALPTGSTDANAGVVRGVPSISVGRSEGGDAHTLTEWAHWPSALPATQALLLLTVALTELAAPVP